jgi:Predicted membrane protein
MTLIAIALTFASGANDVASFTRLGGVFTSVMTGNIVLWGLSAAQRSVSLFSHTAVSIAGYITGVVGGTWVAHGFKVRGDDKPDRADRAGVLPATSGGRCSPSWSFWPGSPSAGRRPAPGRPGGRSSCCSR